MIAVNNIWWVLYGALLMITPDYKYPKRVPTEMIPYSVVEELFPEGKINKNEFSISSDSLYAAKYNSNYYISLEDTLCDENHNCLDLFAFNPNKKLLVKLTNFNYAAGDIGFVFLDSYFSYVRRSGADHPSHSSIICITKEKPFECKSLTFKDLDVSNIYGPYILNDSLLFIKVTEYDEEIDMLHYLLYFAPRGRPSKWKTKESSYRIKYYIFDRELNIKAVKEG